MKYLEEYRDAEAAKRWFDAIQKTIRRPWTLMELCGGQTHAIVKYGLDRLLPKTLTLLHGPGCPVCVTPVEAVDRAIEIASRDSVIFCSFGDMLRVPGSSGDLLSVQATKGDVRIVYSPLDAVEIAVRNPEKEVVFFAVGFETTAPANAMAVFLARERGLKNFSLLVSQVLVPPAMELILASPENRVQGFLAAGHVCTVMGYQEYIPIAKAHHVPIVVTGFEPVDILQGIFMCVRQLEEGRAELENPYARSVRPEGNALARRMIEEVFRVIPRKWRGLGELPRSGLGLRPAFSTFDAEIRFGVAETNVYENPDCLSGLILRGLRRPTECPAFGRLCTPERPLGATMVSSEGACAAYYRYRGEEICR